jgi:hypothetical protein
MYELSGPQLRCQSKGIAIVAKGGQAVLSGSLT